MASLNWPEPNTTRSRGYKPWNPPDEKDALAQTILLQGWHECIRDFLQNQHQLTQAQHDRIEESIWHCTLDITDKITEAISEIVGYHNAGAEFLAIGTADVSMDPGVHGAEARGLVQKCTAFAQFPPVEAVWRPWHDKKSLLRIDNVDGRAGSEDVLYTQNATSAQGKGVEVEDAIDSSAIKGFAVGFSTCIFLMVMSWCIERVVEWFWALW